MRDYNGSNNADLYSGVGNGQDCDIDPAAAFTMSCWVVVDAYAQYRRLISWNSNNLGFQIVFPTNSNTLGALTGSASSGWGEPAGSPTKYVACSNGSMYHLWLTTEADDATRAFRFWVNGVEATSTDGATGYNAGTSNSTLNLGRRSDGAQYADCKIGEFMLIEGVEITDQATIDSVRYGMSPLNIRPDLNRLYIPLRTDNLPIRLPAGGHPTSVSTAGTPALSTTHPNVMLPGARVRRRVPAASGATSVTPNGPAAITLTGFAPTPTVTASVAPGVGAISLTGHAPGLMISPQPGTAQIALTGLPPTPTVAASVAPGVGALSLTGHAPGLRLGAEPGTGAIVVTGHAPTVTDYGGTPDTDGPNLQGFMANVGSMMDR